MGSPEGADAEIEKDHHHTRRDPERSVVAGVPVRDPGAPKRGSEDNDGEKKKDAGDLEPKNAAHAAEWTQQSAHAAAHGTPGLAQRLPCLNRRAACRLAGGAVLASRAGNRSGLMHLRSGGRGLRVGRQVMPSHTPNDAHSNAQGAANHARSHTVYDGSSGLERFRALPELLS